jgi:D-3-phosphoglycerate dehydrogenase
MKGKVLITAFVHPSLAPALTAMGYELVVNEKINRDELMATIREYTGIIITTRLIIDKAVLDQAIQLKWLGRLGSGMEIVDTACATQKNIQCFSSPEGNCDAVAEWCLGTLISLRRNILLAAQEVKQAEWIRENNRGWELKGKTVGIIGYGNTGQAFASFLAPFGVKVLAHDKYKQGFGSGHVVESSLEEILEKADVVSFHLPLSEETQHYANEDFLKKLQRKPYLLNSSRGSVLDTGALQRALDAGWIAGAGLDVLENEQLATYLAHEKQQLHDLTHRSNVIITPHIAGYSHEALFKMADIIVHKLKAAGY